eukprot:TRINITY_DN22365_c0_g1_i1.p1 TRINITY_DN22365_c0_g1~~TRINITY_DN22365_c0_g1_i1.p1  ORF type:complete len:347 (-),score=88.02 TRINITY_DN22365_c0_g1_i1:25-1035(-)
MDVDYRADNPFDDSSEEVNFARSDEPPFRDDGPVNFGSSERKNDHSSPPVLPAKNSPKPKKEKEKKEKKSKKENSSITLTSSTTSSDPNLASREAELRRREEELNRREAQLNEREKAVSKQSGGKLVRPPNWPFFKPFLYQNISLDSPTASTRKLLRMAYVGWLASLVVLVWNFICMLTLLVTNGIVGDFIISILYGVVLPVIWFFIFRTLYRAVRKSKASVYIIFWIFFVLEIASTIMFTIGLKGGGAGGIFWMVSLWSVSTPIAIMFLVCTILWGALAALNVGIFIFSRVEYGRIGGSARAKEEVKKGATQFAVDNPEIVIASSKHAIDFANRE